MERYETVEIRYKQLEDLDRQLYELRKRNWYPCMSRNFFCEGDVFGEWVTFKVFED